MKKGNITFFAGVLLLLSGFIFAQSDNFQGGLQFEVPQHIQILNKEIHAAEVNENWDEYYRLREQIISEWQQVNPEVAKLYRNVNEGIPDTTPDSAPADHKRKNISELSEGFLFELPDESSSLWGNDVLVTSGRAYDISMDISRDGEIYVAVLGHLDGTTGRDSVYIFKSDDGGETWSLWSFISASTQTFDKIEIMCFDGFPGSTGDSYILIFYLFENGWLRVGRTETSSPGSWSYYTISGSSGEGYTTDFAVDRNYPSGNYRAMCVYDSLNRIKSIRSDPASNGTVWQDVVHINNLLGRPDLDFCYGFNGGTYVSFNGLNTGNLYAIENPNFADPASWGSQVTLVEGASDTTRHVQIISSRHAIPDNIVMAVFERQIGTSFDLYFSRKPAGSSDWNPFAVWVLPEENKWPALYSRKENGNNVFRGVFQRSAEGNLPPYTGRYKEYDGTSWTQSYEISDQPVTGLQKPEVGDLDGNTPVFAYAGINFMGVYFDNFNWISTIVDENSGITPESYSLRQNYPNPFNPSTIISWYIPEHSYVSLKVYDVLGREVVALVNEAKSAGTYEVIYDATGLTSGVYFLKMEASSLEGANSFSETKKMLLMK